MQPIRVAIIGAGNVACSLVQAISSASESDGVGVVHPVLGGYRIDDIEIAAAFDVDRRKVGLPLAEALFAAPNCTTRYTGIAAQVPVSCGMLADGVSSTLRNIVDISPEAETVSVDDVAQVLKLANVTVVVNLLPVGSHEATRNYAEATLRAGAAFVNCIPESVAGDADWHERFAAARLPLLGDDIKSQLGATAVHRALLDLCRAKAARVVRTYQLNVGGNTDFQNMTDPARAASKRRSKIASLEAITDPGVPVDAGPSGYVSSIEDNKVAHIHIDGELLLGMPFSMDLRLQVEDSPNAAGVAVDAIRAARIALDRGRAGAVPEACGLLFKAPPQQSSDREAADEFAAFAGAAAPEPSESSDAF
ncbi:MAG: inositol-3-phosphate synthase [Streptomyces sp.]|nr:inositol-3-phosphate synthase [Streptomyces sp.]